MTQPLFAVYGASGCGRGVMRWRVRNWQGNALLVRGLFS